MKRLIIAGVCVVAMLLMVGKVWSANQDAVLENDGGRVEAGDKLVEAPVTRVNLFKNGIGMVTRTFEVGSEGGTFVITDVPDPVHGTFWVQSVSGVDVRFAEREVPGKPAALDRQTLIRQLTGRMVDVYLDDGGQVTGTLLRVTEEPSNDFSTDYERSHGGYYYYGYYPRPGSNGKPAAADEFMVIETEDGTEFIDVNLVKRIRLNGNDGRYEPVVRRSVMLFTVAPSRKRQVISFSYLTKGISWAPSYRLDVDGGNGGRLSMKAAIKNELMDIKDAEFYLISGYPAIRFGHVKSPLSPNTDWEQFFSELAYDPQVSQRNNGMDIMTQAVTSNSVSVSGNTGSSTTPTPDFITEEFDIHHLDAGKHTVARGESIAIQIADAPIDYETIVEWQIPDDRDRYGLYYYGRYSSNPNDVEKMDDVWDAIKFKNPFDFPMTTAPMATYKNGRFYGQTMTYWTAPGQELMARVTKALNIRVLHSEQETDQKRNAYSWLGNTFQRCKVKGQVYVHNNRSTAETIVIRRKFSGTLKSADGEPEKVLLASGVWSVNESTQLTWELELKPGEERTLEYEYEVLSRQ